MRIDRERIIVLVVAAVLGAGYFFGVWRPLQQRRAELQARIDEQRHQTMLDRQAVQDLPELRRAIDQLRQIVDQDNRNVPMSPELADLLRRIADEMEAQDLKNPETQTEPMVTGARFTIIPFTLRFEGGSDQVFAFVRSIESMRRLVRIDDLTIDAEPADAEKPLSVRIKLSAFAAGNGGAP